MAEKYTMQATRASPLANHAEKDLESASLEPLEPTEALADTDIHLTRPGLGQPKDSFLSRVVTGRSLAASWVDPGPPPDGGRLAWTQAVMGHLVIFTTWGYVSSYGTFQTYYVTALDRPPSDISWVGSVQIFLLFFISTFTGRAMDAGLFRPVFAAGLCLQLLGVFMTSLCTQYWQLFLAQGVCTGIGNGMQFSPTMSLISTYFSTNRALAIAIAAGGTATGGMLFPGLVEALLPRIGFAWTIRVLGFIMLPIGLTALTLLKTRLPPRKSGPLIEWGAFKEPPFMLFISGMFLVFWSIYFAVYYVSAFGRNRIGFTYAASINLIIALNGVGLIGRILPAFLSDRYFGPLNTIIPAVFLSSIVVFCWAAVDSKGGLWAFACIYGLVAAAIQSMWPATLSSMNTDLKKAGVRMGMGFTVVSFATLTGPPLGGALVQSMGGGYLYAQMWAGTAMAVGGLLILGSRYVKVGTRVVRV